MDVDKTTTELSVPTSELVMGVLGLVFLAVIFGLVVVWLVRRRRRIQAARTPPAAG